MKKNYAHKKLTLSKMTVAKLKMNKRQMYLINGGNDDATRPIRPTSKSISYDGDNNLLTCGAGNHNGSGTQGY
jgi:hypothetical protein